jgi:hypothetical protein
MTTVEDAQTTLTELNAKREAAVAHLQSLEHGRQKLAFKAMTGNKAERAKLDQLNKEALTQEYELRSLDSAVTEATTRLAEARRQEALAADRAQAQLLRSAVEVFVQHGRDLDKTLQLMAAHGRALHESLNEIHGLGSDFPKPRSARRLGRAGDQGRPHVHAIQNTRSRPSPPRTATTSLVSLKAGPSA